MDRALRHYEAREYVPAAAAIEAAYAIDPKPDLLYMWAQTERLSGDCETAMPLYRRYLATSPGRVESQRAEKNMARCDPQRPPPLPAVVARPPQPPHPPPPPWYRDRLGHALAGGGVLALGAAGGFELAARHSLGAAFQAETYDAVARHADAAATRERFALGALVIGSALLVAAATRYLLRSMND